VSFLRAGSSGVTLTLKVQPKASRDAIEGAVETPDGWALKVAVSAPPDKGKANAAVIAALAKSFGVAKSRITVTHGETDRRKIVQIDGDPARLTAIAQQWMPS
jgi:uncharacterized protein (TIGR00251 family)